jgi:hypothetical protein
MTRPRLPRPWTEIPPGEIAEEQTSTLRYRKWPALDSVDRGEELVAEFGEEILEAIEHKMNMSALVGQSREPFKALLVSALRSLVGKLGAKVLRRYVVQYFAAAQVESLVDGEWLPLVETSEGGEPEPFLDEGGIDEAQIPLILWRMVEVHIIPFFGGLLSRAVAKAETSSTASSPPAGTS